MNSDEDDVGSNVGGGFDLDGFESRSVCTSVTSTIHPDEVKARLKKQIASKERRMHRRKCVAKGEASTVTRTRRENHDTIKHSDTGVWG